MWSLHATITGTRTRPDYRLCGARGGVVGREGVRGGRGGGCTRAVHGRSLRTIAG